MAQLSAVEFRDGIPYYTCKLILPARYRERVASLSFLQFPLDGLTRGVRRSFNEKTFDELGRLSRSWLPFVSPIRRLKLFSTNWKQLWIFVTSLSTRISERLVRGWRTYAIASETSLQRLLVTGIC